MVATRPFILYSLSKDRTTQKFRKGKKVEIIWDDIRIFLDLCTTANRDEPSGITLTVYEAYKDDKNPEVAKKIIQDTKRIFGRGQTNNIAVDYPKATTWEIETKDLSKTIDYIIDGQPWPKFFFGPIELIITYWFKLVDPKTKKELPNQEYQSNLMVWLSRNSCCSSDLFFPFTGPDENFKDYLFQLNKYLPFNLETKYLKLGKPNKDRTSNYFRKLSGVSS